MVALVATRLLAGQRDHVHDAAVAENDGGGTSGAGLRGVGANGARGGCGCAAPRSRGGDGRVAGGGL